MRRHPVASFFCLAYAFSWSIAVPLALQARGVTGTQLPMALHYVTAFGPAIAAVVVGRAFGPALQKRDGGSFGPALRTRARDRAIWWFVGAVSPLLLFLVAQLTAGAAGHSAPEWRALGQISFLPDLGFAAYAFWFLTNGLGEESGWRGFALPQLQRTHSVTTSTLLVATGWAGWHIPMLFYLPGYAALSLVTLPGFFLGILAGAVVLTWLYNRSGGSLVAVALWHASFNFVTASPNSAGLPAAITSALVMVWAVLIVGGSFGPALRTRALRTHRSVRATKAERARTLPGDERLLKAIDTLTQGITIRGAPHAVWPWIVQMGAGSRAGWYSYDRLDNAGHPSAAEIIPALQHPTVGTIFPALPGITDGFTLLAIEPERTLTLGWIGPDGTTQVTWTFVLEEPAPGFTRLLVRARGGQGYRFHGLPLPLTKIAIRFVHFIMQRKQLLEIRTRVERSPRSPSERRVA